MNFSEFSKKLYKNLSGLNNQGYFIGALFNAAGSNFFELKPAYNTDGYQRKVYRGDRSLTQDMKDSFPKPINSEKLIDFFQSRIGETALIKLMEDFGIPKGEPQDKELLCRALCKQLHNIVTDASNEVDNIVASEYSRLLSDPCLELDNVTPNYPGDDFILVSVNPLESHVVGFYHIFEHQWILKNNGTVIWENRYLECVNQAEIRIRALNKIVSIPKTRPGENAVIKVQFDSRGFEGKYESIWEMKDINGTLCFPNKSNMLRVAAVIRNACGNSREA